MEASIRDNINEIMDCQRNGYLYIKGRNGTENRKKDFYVNSIRQVERVTGYRFFPQVGDSIKNMVWDMDDISIW